MTIVIEAVYENGVFKPLRPLTLVEGTEVRLTVATAAEDDDPLAAVIGIAEGPPEGDGAENHDKYIYGTLQP
jgi:predicted DNA-binding antitoxin AbrB/MazE fold protein